MLNIILHNPYRYLGVYSNSPTKERVANQTKINAFPKVGKQVSFPLDLPDILGSINRTIRNVSEAEARLTLPTDQVKFAQFWWMNATHIDNIAFNHLVKGDTDMAKSIWEVKEDASSLQNRLVLALIQSDYSCAIKYAEILYKNYSPTFISNLIDIGVSLDGTTLAHNFIDVLIEDGLDVSTLQALISDNEWKIYLSEKIIVPLIDDITQSITAAETSKGKGPNARYEAGIKLMETTKEPLHKLKTFITKNDIRYGTIADKLGLAILQCGIDYYNNTDDDEAAYNSIKLQSYALSIVVGTLAKERCKDNVDILERTISKLPPAEVIIDYRAIMRELKSFSRFKETIDNALDLLDKTNPHLKAIKAKLGDNDYQYLKLSTDVVAGALNAIIVEVNASQEDSSFGHSTRSRTIINKAWTATLIMDSFDMEYDFRMNRYIPNRTTLKNIYDRFFTVGYSPRTKTTPSTTTNTSSSSDGGVPNYIFVIIFALMAICFLCIICCNNN